MRRGVALPVVGFATDEPVRERAEDDDQELCAKLLHVLIPPTVDS